MPGATIPLGLTVYELAALGATSITALFFTTPAGKEVTQDAAKAADRALQNIKDSILPKPEPEPEPEPKPRPIPYPKTKEDCPKKKKCPVCGKLVCKGMVSEKPGYVPPQYPPPGRTPIDKETILAGPQFTKQSGIRPVKGATVYRGMDDRLYYRDTLHKGERSEIEVFDSRGKKHQGTLCPNCGQPLDGPDADKKPIVY